MEEERKAALNRALFDRRTADQRTEVIVQALGTISHRALSVPLTFQRSDHLPIPILCMTFKTCIACLAR